VLCWGGNMFGALGDGTEKKSETPVKVAGLAGVAEIRVDFARSCARTTSGFGSATPGAPAWPSPEAQLRSRFTQMSPPRTCRPASQGRA